MEAYRILILGIVVQIHVRFKQDPIDVYGLAECSPDIYILYKYSFFYSRHYIALLIVRTNFIQVIPIGNGFIHISLGSFSLKVTLFNWGKNKWL